MLLQIDNSLMSYSSTHVAVKGKDQLSSGNYQLGVSPVHPKEKQREKRTFRAISRRHGLFAGYFVVVFRGKPNIKTDKQESKHQAKLVLKKTRKQAASRKLDQQRATMR